MANEALISRPNITLDSLTFVQLKLIEFLKENGPATRRELVKRLNMPRTTVYDNLLKLQKQKMVEKNAKNNGRRGRPLVYWKFMS